MLHLKEIVGVDPRPFWVGGKADHDRVKYSKMARYFENAPVTFVYNDQVKCAGVNSLWPSLVLVSSIAFSIVG